MAGARPRQITLCPPSVRPAHPRDPDALPVRTECCDTGRVKKPKQETAVPLALAAAQGSRGTPRARPCRLRPCAAAASRSPDAEGQR